MAVDAWACAGAAVATWRRGCRSGRARVRVAHFLLTVPSVLAKAIGCAVGGILYLSLTALVNVGVVLLDH